MNDSTQNATEGQQTKAYAAWYGLWIGVCWVLSFGLSMWGLKEPFAGNFGLLAGVGSVPLAIWLLRGFNEMISPLSLRRAWHMAWLMFLYAALLTTAAQYIFFAYMDNGLLVRTYTEMIKQPEIQDLMAQLMPGQDANRLFEDAITLFSTTPVSQLSLQFLFWNVILATVLSIPTAFLSYKKKPSSQTPKGKE